MGPLLLSCLIVVSLCGLGLLSLRLFPEPKETDPVPELGDEHARYLTAHDRAWLEWACPSITTDNRMPWRERIHHGAFMGEPEPSPVDES